jgi:hypothetical protein
MEITSVKKEDTASPTALPLREKEQFNPSLIAIFSSSNLTERTTTPHCDLLLFYRLWEATI